VQQNLWTQWTLQNSNTTNELYGISFSDSIHGWAVGNNGTILKTKDGGINWISSNSPISTILTSVSFCDTMNGWIVGDEGRIFTTSNGGKMWKLVEHDISTNIVNIKVQCISPSTAVVFRAERQYDIVHDYRLWITSDTGNTWKLLGGGNYTIWNDFHFVNDSLGFYVGISGPAYEKLIVARTQDGGLTKDTINIRWKVQGGGRKIYFKNKNQGWLLADSVYRTTNSGIDWKGITKNSLNTQKAFIMFGDTGYIVHTDGKIFNTIDGGFSWNHQSSITTSVNNIYFLNSKTGWAVGSNGTIVNTNNGGITNVDDDTNLFPNLYLLKQNYPNPFNPTTIIEYSLSKGLNVKLIVFDILGRQIETLVDDFKQSGNYKVEFNADNLSSGIYFYKLQTANYSETKKFLLLK
jgi:photosystem II stability/assembly factor-like uncharacterized protein